MQRLNLEYQNILMMKNIDHGNNIFAYFIYQFMNKTI